MEINGLDNEGTVLGLENYIHDGREPMKVIQELYKKRQCERWQSPS
jgi:hypothetical protein